MSRVFRRARHGYLAMPKGVRARRAASIKKISGVAKAVFLIGLPRPEPPWSLLALPPDGRLPPRQRPSPNMGEDSGPTLCRIANGSAMTTPSARGGRRARLRPRGQGEPGACIPGSMLRNGRSATRGTEATAGSSTISACSSRESHIPAAP